MTETTTHQTPPTPSASMRASFARDEIMRVLDQYSTGAVHSVREMIAGSSEAPKVVVECERGKLLLKRRARGLEHAVLVGFAHEVILGCLEQGVCVPPLIGTTAGNNSMCQMVDQTYELFVFIDGAVFDQSIEHARQSGMLLGELHRCMDSITTTFEPTTESVVVNPQRVDGFEFSDAETDRIRRVLEYGLDAHRANARPNAIVHGDWHPGNMIFSGPEIIAICDFDNCRIGSRDRELAQALVYLSMKRPAPGNPIPNEASMDHLLAVWDGYCAQSGTHPNPKLIGALMPAVLLDEAFASAGTGAGSGTGEGSAGHIQPNPLVQAAIKKSIWLDEHNPEIIRSLEQR
ncbi:MAG: phosphotransferase enzyme family protein [Phycisphaerales bacterium]